MNTVEKEYEYPKDTVKYKILISQKIMKRWFYF